MSRVALIRLPYNQLYSVYGKLPKNHELRPPLGLMYVAAALEKDGHEVGIFDGACGDAVLQALSYNTDFIGISATTPEIGLARSTAEHVKRFCKRTVTILGGPHATALAESINAPEFDYIVVGEGETAMCSIVGGRPTNRIVQCPDIEDLDSLPFPARHLVDYRNYKYPVPNKGLVKTDVVQSIRGCPYRCTFCSSAGTTPRFRTPRLIGEEIERSYKDNGVKFVMFLDDTLTFKRSHIIAICNEIMRRNLHKVLGFCGWVRADTVDKPLLTKMAMAGFKELSMGVETGSESLAAFAKKGTTLKQVRKAYEWMSELGIQARGSFIIGLPGERHYSARLTVDFAKSLELNRVSCNIATPYPGTKLFDQAERGDGIKLLTRNWDEYRRWGNSVVETDGLSKEDLENYQRDFLTQFYSQWKVLWYHLKQFWRGNRSLYFYRPIFFALKNRLKTCGY